MWWEDIVRPELITLPAELTATDELHAPWPPQTRRGISGKSALIIPVEEEDEVGIQSVVPVRSINVRGFSSHPPAIDAAIGEGLSRTESISDDDSECDLGFKVDESFMIG